jgi:hypothetical protein
MLRILTWVTIICAAAASVPAAAEAPIVLDWKPGVGGPKDTSTPIKQALNEVMPRHIYLRRTLNDDRELRVAWRVRPMEGDLYPAKPSLFGSDEYPSGTVIMAPSARMSDIVIRTVRTNIPDWNRDFEVVLTDAETGRPILNTNGTPITVGFSVAGDLKCKIGRPDRCDPTKNITQDEKLVDSAATLRDTSKLLSTFCPSQEIRGSECLNAINYRRGQICNVKVTGGPYTGHFIAYAGEILVAPYQSDCEPHATDFGGSILFEKIGGNFVFEGFQPGYRANECIVVPESANHDRLVCIASFNGQGHTESSVNEVVFTRQSSKSIGISFDRIIGASDDSAAYGLNQVDCSGSFENLRLSKLGPGPAAGTVTAELEYADDALIKIVCASSSSAPKEALIPSSPGTAFIPQDSEKHRRVVINLAHRNMVAVDDFRTKP